MVIDRLRGAGCVFAEDEADLILAEDASADAVQALVERRVRGEPLEHVLGWALFCGIRVRVARGVFVPRRRTELLARQAMRLLAQRAAGQRRQVVLDLCCGSGAVAAAVLRGSPGPVVLEVHCVDVDPAAVACARENVVPLGGRVHCGDLYGPLDRTRYGQVDLIVANPPYVPTSAIGSMPREAREHEASVALDGGPDGLDLVRRVVGGGSGWLGRSGCVLVEVGRHQSEAALEVMSAAGLAPWVVIDADLGGVVVGGARIP